MTGYVFVADPTTLRDEDTLVLEVDPTLESKDALLAWFAKHLKFPDYFGMNWDAFDECLRDLSGVNERKIVLFHRDLPLAGQPREQATYLSLLSDTAEYWRADSTREFVIAMDPQLRERLT